MPNIELLKSEEKLILKLREIYRKYGYSQYRMSKFEDYDVYAKHKDFLVSDHIITFTDTNGKLMAMKPDVTLSIIRNIKDKEDGCQKLCYNENVYRVSKSSNSFRELMQVGLECIGRVDDYSITETLILAAESLFEISENYVLVISHLDILSELLDRAELPKNLYKKITGCIESKNLHELTEVCREAGLPSELPELIKNLISIHMTPKEALIRLKQLLSDSPAVKQLETIVSGLEASSFKDKMIVDLSLINDMNYYNGIIFRGYVQNVPSTVLSGGQYDKLMKRLKKNSDAIGFAIYMDVLDLLAKEADTDMVDKVILYDKNTDISKIISETNLLRREDLSFTVTTSVPKRLKYREILDYTDKGGAGYGPNA